MNNHTPNENKATTTDVWSPQTFEKPATQLNFITDGIAAVTRTKDKAICQAKCVKDFKDSLGDLDKCLKKC